MGTTVIFNRTLLKPVRSKTAVALHFAISAASPTALATVGTTTRAAVVALCFAIPGRPSFTNRLRDCSCDSFRSFTGAVLRNPWRLSFTNRLRDCSCDSFHSFTGAALRNPASPTDFATVGATASTASLALHFAIPAGPASPTDFATVGATASAAFLALHFAIPAGPASPTDFATVGATASAAFLALHLAIPGGPGSPTDFATVGVTACAALLALHLAIPGGPASPRDFATAAISAVLVVPIALDQEYPASSCKLWLEAELLQQTSTVVSTALALFLQSLEAEPRQEPSRVLGRQPERLPWHRTSQSLGAELQQRTLRLLYRHLQPLS